MRGTLGTVASATSSGTPLSPANVQVTMSPSGLLKANAVAFASVSHVPFR